MTQVNDDSPLTFSELDRLCDLDPLSLTVENLDRLILGMRAYRANALGKGKAAKFSDESGLGAKDIREALQKSGAMKPVEKIGRRL